MLLLKTYKTQYHKHNENEEKLKMLKTDGSQFNNEHKEQYKSTKYDRRLDKNIGWCEKGYIANSPNLHRKERAIPGINHS